ncbi:MAG: ferritin [Thermotogota bacterium]|nr:ferritin [Thermotogota bacterium]MDK2864932.1 ferritin [Thermotogota bacterium]HCZ07279.1 ferritin [Thermotogota bacterium]
MKINATVEKALNEQINRELYSAYLYLAMAAYLDEKNLPGAAHWMRVQAQEEVGHAMRLYNYVVERRGRVVLEAIEKPPVEWKSITDVFESALKHEEKVTSHIHSLVDLAQEEGDHATVSMLKWFVDEQVEEEASVDEILQKLRYLGEDGRSLIILDRELAQRQG